MGPEGHDSELAWRVLKVWWRGDSPASEPTKKRRKHHEEDHE
jgi:hypothetical protein